MSTFKKMVVYFNIRLYINSLIISWFAISAEGAIRMTVVDSAMTREVMRDISKRSALDLGGLDVHVMHGVIYLRGRLEKIRGGDETDLHEELHVIVKLLRLKPGIRDVVCEVEVASSNQNPKRYRY